MKKFFQNKHLSILSAVIVGVMFGLIIQFASAWTPPTAPAPGGNVAAPITTNGGQTIKENLMIKSSYTSGFLSLFGRDIKTANNQDLYLNWDNASGNVVIGGEGEKKTLTVNGELRGVKNIMDLINPVSYNNPTWVTVFDRNNILANTGGQLVGWSSVALDANRPVLGLRLSGSSDDGGLCTALISGYVAVGVSSYAYYTTLDIWFNRSGTMWSRPSGAFPTTEFILANMSAGTFLGDQTVEMYGYDYDGNSFAYNHTAYSKAAGANFNIASISPGKTLHVLQDWNNGQGPGGNHCKVDVLYAN